MTKDDANKIAVKLGAEIDTKRKAHDLAVVSHDGVDIVHFGIRRGSKRDLPHPHIPKQLHISKKECVELATCTLSKDAWVEKMKQIGVIEPK